MLVIYSLSNSNQEKVGCLQKKWTSVDRIQLI